MALSQFWAVSVPAKGSAVVNIGAREISVTQVAIDFGRASTKLKGGERCFLSVTTGSCEVDNAAVCTLTAGSSDHAEVALEFGPADSLVEFSNAGKLPLCVSGTVLDFAQDDDEGDDEEDDGDFAGEVVEGEEDEEEILRAMQRGFEEQVGDEEEEEEEEEAEDEDEDEQKGGDDDDGGDDDEDDLEEAEYRDMFLVTRGSGSKDQRKHREALLAAMDEDGEEIVAAFADQEQEEEEPKKKKKKKTTTTTTKKVKKEAKKETKKAGNKRKRSDADEEELLLQLEKASNANGKAYADAEDNADSQEERKRRKKEKKKRQKERRNSEAAAAAEERARVEARSNAAKAAAPGFGGGHPKAQRDAERQLAGMLRNEQCTFGTRQQKQAARWNYPSSSNRGRGGAGVLVQDVVPPAAGGAGKRASRGSRVGIVYKGFLTNGKKFDAGKLNFRVGLGEVVKGFDIGVMGMKPGQCRRVIIPPALGYGKRRAGPIPANSTLVFDIKLADL